MHKICLILTCLACLGSQAAASRKPYQGGIKSFARLLLKVNASPAFNPSAPRAGISSTAVSTRRSHCRHSTAVMDDLPSTATTTEDLERLSLALEVAVRMEDYEQAARLRDQLKEVEEADLGQALIFQQQRQVRSMLEQALFSGEAVEARDSAIQSLKELARPPSSVAGAEDALHKILRDVRGPVGEQISEMATSALWDVWLQSGDEKIDEEMEKGVQLMKEKRLKEAAEVFTEIISLKPNFAEAWNKRATVYFIMKDFKKSMADCERVLKMKPRHFGCLSGLAMCYFSLDPPDIDKGLKWCQQALDVHPRLHNLKLVESKLTMQSIMREEANPRIERAKEALKKGREPEFEEEDVACEWDVHRISGEQNGVFRYFFRLKYKNKGTKTVSATAKSLARFYVLQFEDGEFFQFTRPIEEASPSQFSLGPGDEYKFCWMLIVSREVKGMTGGTIFEVLDESARTRQGFTNAGMPVLNPQKAYEVSTTAEVEQLGDGHYFTGQLDLRNYQ